MAVGIVAFLVAFVALLVATGQCDPVESASHGGVLSRNYTVTMGDSVYLLVPPTENKCKGEPGVGDVDGNFFVDRHTYSSGSSGSIPVSDGHLQGTIPYTDQPGGYSFEVVDTHYGFKEAGSGAPLACKPTPTVFTITVKYRVMGGGGGTVRNTPTPRSNVSSNADCSGRIPSDTSPYPNQNGIGFNSGWHAHSTGWWRGKGCHDHGNSNGDEIDRHDHPTATQ